YGEFLVLGGQRVCDRLVDVGLGQRLGLVALAAVLVARLLVGLLSRLLGGLLRARNTVGHDLVDVGLGECLLTVARVRLLAAALVAVLLARLLVGRSGTTRALTVRGGEEPD